MVLRTTHTNNFFFAKMFSTQNIVKLNTKIATKLFDVRPINAVFRKYLSQTEESDLFKFYSDKVNDLSDKYRPLSDEDYNRFISTRSAKREPALTRQITSLAYKVGKKMVSLAEGMPNEEVFPFSRMTLETKTGDKLVMEGQEMVTALQYVPSQGLPPLITALRQFQEDLHRPPPLPREVLVTNGAQHGIYQCFELLVEPGDPVLMSEFAYTGAHVALKPYDPEILGIPEDADGMDPSIMESILKERLAQGQKMPKVLYTIPTGNNPSGTLLSEERKRQIYELACRYDFLIIEDDPYMFLNYTERPAPSFLSLDVCGRVLRLDSFSKVVSAGLRAAWCLAPAALARRMELHMQAELLHSCSLSQAILHRLLSSRSSLASHLVAARRLYARRRDALHAALRRAGVQEVARWHVPDAGLFLWLNVSGVDDVYNLVFHTAFERGLMLVPGQAFQYDTSAPCRHIRLTYSKIPLEHMNTAARTLADIIRSEQGRSLGETPQRIATER